MILIAESGSTKTHWCLIDSNINQTIFNSKGINPLILTNDEIEKTIQPIALQIGNKQLSAIHFFGAGCSTVNAIMKIENQLSLAFNCEHIHVDTDLKAACLSLAGNQNGIIAILGTGSNSCFWNGTEIEYKIPSLGYILGDEGGGVSIGKQLISDFLKKKMPDQIYQAFSEKYKLTTEMVIEQVYSSSMPNRFLAGFAPFANEYFETEYCQKIIYNQFDIFLKDNILMYHNAHEHDVYFCGTIAFYHKNTLAILCNKYNLNLKSVIKEPITDLIKYFTSI